MQPPEYVAIEGGGKQLLMPAPKKSTVLVQSLLIAMTTAVLLFGAFSFGSSGQKKLAERVDTNTKNAVHLLYSQNQKLVRAIDIHAMASAQRGCAAAKLEIDVLGRLGYSETPREARLVKQACKYQAPFAQKGGTQPPSGSR